MRRVIAFGASSSRKSINKRLATYIASLIKDSEIEILDLNDFELPLFSVDREIEIGYPPPIEEFIKKISGADLILISFAEHNGSYTVAYKNLYDWCSRLNKNLYRTKRFILFSTSPGFGGAKRVLKRATEDISRFGGIVLGTLSIPSFNHNFDTATNKLINRELDIELKDIIKSL